MNTSLWTARLLRGVLLAVLCTLSACGGGGGGGGGSSSGGSSGGGPGPLVFTASTNSVSFSFNQGATVPAPQIITVNATGSFSGTLYIAAVASGPGLASPIAISINGTTATIPVQPASGLVAGTYNGTLKLLACSDQACNNQVGNSPLSVAFTIQVIPTLQVTPSSFSPSLVSGTTASQSIAVQLPAGQSSFLTQVQSNTPWLTVKNVTSSGFSVAVAALPSGTWNGSVVVTSGSNSGTVAVNATVTPPVGGDKPMNVAQANVTLSAVEDTVSAPALLTVSPPSWNPQVSAVAEYASSGPSGWLSVSPVSGGFQVTANAANLSAGTYTGDVRVSGAYPQADIVVPVAFTVGVGLVQPADLPISLNAETTNAALVGTVPVNLNAGPVVGFSAVSDANWLQLTTSSGNTGGTIGFAIDAPTVAGLANAAIYTAHVTITPSRSSMSPVTFNVVLNKQLPQVTSLAPYVQLTGQASTRVILRGSGFSFIKDSTPHLHFTLDDLHALKDQVTIVNDTEAVVYFPALANGGSYTAAVSNLLTMQTPTGTVQAVSPPTSLYSYKAIANTGGGQRGALAYDPQRNSLYIANRTQGKVTAYHFDGLQWTTTSTPAPSVYDLGLSTDGSALFIASSASTTGSFTSLDPVTLTVQRPAVTTNPLQPTFDGIGFGVVPTNDGRSWFGVGTLPSAGQNFGDLTYITTTNLAPTIVTPSLPGINSGSALNGPWFAGSRDGETLLAALSASETPTPPLLWLHAADETFQVVPGGVSSSVYHFALSEQGTRILLNNAQLYDNSFNLVGSAVLPGNSYVAISSVVSPDATRVYVLAYPLPASTPRVFVYDAQTASANLNLLGYFDLPDYPSCSSLDAITCYTNGSAAISLDGGTLFFAGDQNFIVAPVPSSLTTLAPAVLTRAMKTQRGLSTVPWPLTLH